MILKMFTLWLWFVIAAIHQVATFIYHAIYLSLGFVQIVSMYLDNYMNYEISIMLSSLCKNPCVPFRVGIKKKDYFDKPGITLLDGK